VTAFTIAYHHASVDGVLSAVHLPDSPEPAPEAVLERLPPAEAELAKSLRGYRQTQFVGGRLALRAACGQLGVTPPPLLQTPRGAPILPKGLVGSVSHKSKLAVAMASRDDHRTLGVDLEDYGPERLNIAPRVLTAGELDEVRKLQHDRQWMAILIRFSIKEAIYKALDPIVQRYVGFHEAIVTPDLSGNAKVHLALANQEGPFEVDAHYEWLHGQLLTSVRISQQG
jgi:enterobactin synthetase component D